MRLVAQREIESVPAIRMWSEQRAGELAAKARYELPKGNCTW